MSNLREGLPLWSCALAFLGTPLLHGVLEGGWVSEVPSGRSLCPRGHRQRCSTLPAQHVAPPARLCLLGVSASRLSDTHILQRGFSLKKSPGLQLCSGLGEAPGIQTPGRAPLPLRTHLAAPLTGPRPWLPLFLLRFGCSVVPYVCVCVSDPSQPHGLAHQGSLSVAFPR